MGKEGSRWPWKEGEIGRRWMAMGGGNRSSLWPWKREEKEDVGSHGGEKSRRMPAAMEEGRRMRKRVVIEKGLRSALFSLRLPP